MALESVTAFQPFWRLPGAGSPGGDSGMGGLARALARRLALRSEASLSLQLIGTAGPPDLAAALRMALGAAPPLALRACERLPARGPLLLAILQDAASPGGRRRGNAVSDGLLAGLVRRCGTPVLPVLAPGGGAHAVVGGLIPQERLLRIGSDAEILRFLRARVELLRHRENVVPGMPGFVAGKGVGILAGATPVAEPVAPDLVRAELAALPPAQRLVESGRFVVVQARAYQIPSCLREIGRLREITFRGVGEGTGSAIDLDAHDRSYRHLLLLDREATDEPIAGAYRFAATDEILPVFGVRGLYTSTLFDLDPELFLGLGPSLELGRSFVRREYQRSYAPLLLLWRGICAFVATHPRYRTLFGPVSVSAGYGTLSRELIAATLSGAATLHPLAEHVAPLRPLAPRRATRRMLSRLPALLEDATELSAVISDLEADGKGLPVLLREYLKLGGRLLGWSVDPAFGGVLDGLIAVDLARSPRRLLDHYMGRHAAQAFLASPASRAATDDCAA